MSAVTNIVLNQGPVRAGELPRSPEVSDRQAGVVKFDPLLVNSSKGMGYGGKSEAIYYVMGKHSKEAVIREWVAVNERKVDAAPRKALAHGISAYGTEWREAWLEVAPDIYDGGGDD